MADGIDIRLLGDNQLQRRFRRLPEKMQKQALRPALRKSATRIKKQITPQIPVDTGELKKVFKGLRTTTQTRRGVIKGAIPQPSDARNAIALNVLEYGKANQPAKAIIRRTTDRMADEELKKIGDELGRKITELASR